MVVFVKPPKGYKPPVDKDGKRIPRVPFKPGKGVELKGLIASPVYVQIRKHGKLQMPKLLGHAATLAEAEAVANGAVIWVTLAKGGGGAWYKHTPRR